MEWMIRRGMPQRRAHHLVGAIVGGAALSLKGRESQTPIPFGPFLAAAGWIAMMWGSEIMDAYLTFSGLR